ncbi:MAG: aldo/keto reductase [Candidatus Sumerlaeia bacterium]|nr:aldo/keto reductase [Candidatus Sumerlaeia bacterium]
MPKEHAGAKAGDRRSNHDRTFGFTSGAPVKDRSKILNYNENMEYRRLGKTDLMISAVCLGGHWKLVNRIIGAKVGDGWQGVNLDQPEFVKNRDEVVSRCIELGINYVDACSGTEIMAYSRALRGRREKMYLGFSWYEYEMRFHPWRDSYEKMMEGFDIGMKQAQLDYVDLWRISMEVDTGKNQTEKEVEIAIKCLEAAKKSGKARFVGLSSHDRVWLKKAIETYPQIEVILTPYTAASKEMPKDSLFDAVRKCDVGVLGIKPFASNSLFKNPGVYDGPDGEENDKRARMAIRNILANPAITAPMPGLISVHQVDNVVQAVKERRQLDLAEWQEFQKVTGEMWASLPPDYQWLRNWEYV